MATVKLDAVSKHYGGFQAVATLSLVVENGEFLVILGPSGCGKTTLLRLIAGFFPPDTGQLLIGGREITHLSPGRRNIGMVFQDYALFPHMTAADNVGFGLRERGIRKRAISARVSEMLDMVRLSNLADAYPESMSGGQQQRVALARALAYSPELLLLDEPLGALDLKLRETMQQEIHQLQRKFATTTIMVTHDQEEAMNLADRIVIMDGGRICQVGTPREIYSTPASIFVARFLGRINILKGELRGTDTDECSVMLNAGSQIVAPVNSQLRSEGAVSIGIRPETLLVRPSHHTETGRHMNRLNGVVRRHIFLGTISRYVVSVKDDIEVIVEDPQREVFLPGTNVSLFWPVELTHLFPPD